MASDIDPLVDQLYRTPKRAEIVGGVIVSFPPVCDEVGFAIGEIAVSLHAQARKTGRALGANVGFLCNLPNRKSFSPDAAYYTGPRAGRKFFPQAPDFAVEIRSEEDSGPVAEHRMSEKRADYFAAGTKVVWDVDLHSDDVVMVYRASQPTTPTIYRRGQQAEAEPAVPSWTMPVDDLFDERIDS